MHPIVKSKDKLFENVQVGDGWIGKRPITAAEIANPCHRWEGKKIKLIDWWPVAAFFEWSFKETSGETMVQFWYHPEHGWKFAPLPQKGHSGMTVSLIEDHPNRIPTMQRMGGPGWLFMGTAHHHCKTSAFQSSTDRYDEITKEGLHITVGNIGEPKYSVHFRASWQKEITPVVLSDWFELPEIVKPFVPPKMADMWIEEILCQPQPDHAFPDWWKENVIKVAAPVIPISSVHSGYNGGYAGHGYQGGSSYKPSYNPRRTACDWNRKKFAVNVKELMKDYMYDLPGIAQALLEIQFAEEIIDEMSNAEVSWKEAVEIVEEMYDEERANQSALKALSDMSDTELEKQLEQQYGVQPNVGDEWHGD